MKSSDASYEIDQAMQQACWQYLMGELSADQQFEFESRLAQSPQLSQLLLDQADLISSLSMLPQVTSVSSSIEVAASSTSWSTLPRIIAAIAASVLLLLAGSLYQASQTPIAAVDRDTTTNELNTTIDPSLIALIWDEQGLAASIAGSETEDDSWIDGETVAMADQPFAETSSVFLDEQLGSDVEDTDTSFEWIYAAVAANPDLLTDGEPHEG